MKSECIYFFFQQSRLNGRYSVLLVVLYRVHHTFLFKTHTRRTNSNRSGNANWLNNVHKMLTRNRCYILGHAQLTDTLLRKDFHTNHELIDVSNHSNVLLPISYDDDNLQLFLRTPKTKRQCTSSHLHLMHSYRPCIHIQNLIYAM